MASSEFPLRTNSELIRILDIYNGSNEIEINLDFDKRRISNRWVESLEKNSMEWTDELLDDPPHEYRITKGYAYCVLNRSFVEYATRDQRALDLLKWTEKTYSPDEL